MANTLYCPDIECDSCIKVISRVLSKKEGVTNFLIKKDSIEVEIDNSLTNLEDILSSIKKCGFRVSTFPFLRKTFKERLRDFKENKEKYGIEIKMLKYSIFVFLLLTLIEALVYFGYFNSIPNFLVKYGWWLFYLNISIVSISSAMWHFKSYQAQVTTMVGMMVGMTFGMQTGMMIGTIFGATNGFFTGGVTGIIAGTLIGCYNGKCAGIMGILEGMMAGLMSGLMGTMIGVMFFIDHIYLFMPLFMFINIFIMWGLSYMLFEEVIESNQNISKKPIDFISFFSYCLIITIILAIIMFYGPKSGFARVW